MGRPRKIRTEEVVKQGKEFGQADAEKLVASAKDLNDFKTVYVTSDLNIFYKQNEGSALAHARKYSLKVFTVNKKKDEQH